MIRGHTYGALVISFVLVRYTKSSLIWGCCGDWMALGHKKVKEDAP